MRNWRPEDGECWVGSVDSAFQPQEHATELENRINAIAELLGVAPNEWGKSVRAFSASDGSCGRDEIPAEFYEQHQTNSIGKFIVAEAFRVLLIEDGGEQGDGYGHIVLNGKTHLLDFGYHGQFWDESECNEELSEDVFSAGVEFEFTVQLWLRDPVKYEPKH